ncbi:MAG: LolA family protein [Planctomycetota bacterium]|jgi:outer membrane lipoprotein-sorting protein
MKNGLILILLAVAFVSQPIFGETTCEAPEDPNTVDAHLSQIFANIKSATEALKTCETEITYLFIQDPELLDSRNLRTGMLYYRKGDKSELRIRFETLKQDDFEAQKRIEDYYFDGVWLIHVDHKLEQINEYQQAPEGKPVGIFELINRQFPLIGFSGVETLQKDFDIAIAKNGDNKSKSTIQLLLTVKKDSEYSKEYTKIDFWIDRATFLPSRIKAYKTQDDVNDIRFSGTKINKNLKKAVFKIETPAHFRKNRKPLKQ